MRLLYRNLLPDRLRQSAIAATYILPVCDASVVNAGQVILAQTIYCIGRVNDNGNTIDGYDIFNGALCFLIVL